MTIRSTLLILPAALALTASSAAPAADGTAVGRWATPAASQPDTQPTIGRWRPKGSVQPQPRTWRPQPRHWRPKGSVQPQPRMFRPKGAVQPQPIRFRPKLH